MPTTSVFREGEAAVPVEFRRLARNIFGETEENMGRLMGELREAIREEGLLIPGEKQEGNGPTDPWRCGGARFNMGSFFTNHKMNSHHS